MTLLLALAHTTFGALWFGAMAYSLGVAQPRITRVLRDPARAEEVYRELAAGNRWRVVALIAVIAGSGIGLAAAGPAGPPGDRGWWALVAAKAALLAAAAGGFWWVSWRGWPARVFALPDELPGHQRRFRRVAVTMTALVGAAFVLGVVAAHR